MASPNPARQPQIPTPTNDTNTSDNQALATHARTTWASLPDVDVEGAVAAGQHARLDHAPGTTAEDATTAAAEAAANAQRQAPPPNWSMPARWSGFGRVVPVLACSAGAGASTVSAVVADALQQAGIRTAIIDTSDPRRSGLASAAASDGPRIPGPHPRLALRSSWRASALLARMDTTLHVVTPGMVPPPRYWLPAITTQAGPPQITVVDIGWDGWWVASHPLAGPGMWLRAGEPTPTPLLVVRPTQPSLIQAEQVLARLEPWIRAGVASAPTRLIVVGARSWPAGVVGAAGVRLASLLGHVVFIPADPLFGRTGVTGAITPPRLRSAVAPVLRGWGVSPTRARPRGART